MINSGAFLQSPEWEKFQKSLGRKTWRIDDILIIKMPLLFGFCYLYSPKLDFKFQISDFRFIEQIKKIAEQERAVFWRVEPQDEQPKKFIKTKDVQPRCTLVTDISKSEDELLAKMHEKTRYNIRLSQKHGVKVEKSEIRSASRRTKSETQFEQFYKLLEQTSARQKIKLHSKEYYKKLVNYSDNNLRGRASYCNEIFIAYHENIPVACAMVNFNEDIATYLHGGSDEKYKNLMAPNLLHWEIIKTAKSRGIKFYDWWGVDEKKWPGITRFKRGFGGAEICAPGAYDLPIGKFWYWLYKFFKRWKGACHS